MITSASVNMIKSSNENDMFIIRELESILGDKDVRKSDHAELRKECEAALESLKSEYSAEQKMDAPSTLPLLKAERSTILAKNYFRPLELACKSKTPRIVIRSLDCLQKLIAYGHLTGNCNDDMDQPMIDEIVETICNCFNGQQTDEGIILQIIKALLTVVTSKHVEIHEETILNAFHTCCSIYLTSRNLAIQNIARATLHQMLDSILDRLVMPVNATEIPKDESERVEICKNNLTIERHVSNNVKTIDESNANAIVNESCDSSLQRIDENLEPPDEVTDIERIAFSVIEFVCNLSSMKPLSDDTPDPKSYELRSKILSLNLLSSTLKNDRHELRANPKFIAAIEQFSYALWAALPNNNDGTSSVPEVFELSLDIILSLLSGFKTHFKMRIEALFNTIFLDPLITSGSTFEHKSMVVQTLTRLCANAQCVVDLYVDYDCDLSAANLFQRLVGDLSKIAQRHQAIGPPGATPVQEKSLRIRGLRCLVSVLKCMVELSEDLYVDPNSRSDHGPESTFARESERDESIEVEDGGNSSDVNATDSTASNTVNSGEEKVSDEPCTSQALKHDQDVWKTGVLMFNRNAKQGINFLREQQFLGTGPSDVAKWFHDDVRLDRRAVGDFLGENEEVMYRYVDRIDFVGKGVVQALRFFLDGFRLPGEAQKIYRLSEKFASRWFECNPNNGLFESADTLSVLSYSIVMLSADLHSSQVKTKMTKEQYINNFRDCVSDNSGVLDDEFLSKIYDDVAGRATQMKSTVKSGTQPSAAIDRMESVSHVRAPFTEAKHLEHVKSMFQMTWSPFLAAFSLGLHDCDDPEIAMLCLDGIRCGIRIACIFHLTLERDAYVQALARFTLLTAISPVTEMKAKNIETIKTLMTVARTDGNYLGSSWLHIVKCVSQLDHAQTVVGTAVRPHFLSHVLGKKCPPIEALGQKLTASDPSVKGSTGETSGQSVVIAVDRIFTGSARLDGEAIVEFVKVLCQVSVEELANSANPRTFCLQKIVEIAYYNVGRDRLQWSWMWRVLGEHFVRAGCHPDGNVATFAVNSLRQLSVKFVEKGELAHSNFQNGFLRPFETIMEHNRSPTVRYTAVGCVAQIVENQAINIGSGWTNIFGTFRLAASGRDEVFVDMSFRATLRAIELFRTYNRITSQKSFQDALKCLSEFACNDGFPKISTEAINSFRTFSYCFHENSQMFDENIPKDLSSPETDGVWIRGWFPLLCELSCIIGRSNNLDIREHALTVLFQLIEDYGISFKSHWWKDLFKIIFRFFDNAKDQEGSVEGTEWMRRTRHYIIDSIKYVFNQYFNILGPILLRDFYAELQWGIEQDDDQLALNSIYTLEDFVLANGPKFVELNWDCTCQAIASTFQSMRPKPCIDDHLSDSPSDSLKPAIPITSKCSILVKLIHTVNTIVFGYYTYHKEVQKFLEDDRNTTIYQLKDVFEYPNYQGFYRILSSDNLLMLTICLLDVHNHTKQYASTMLRNCSQSINSDNDELSEMFIQETESLVGALRIALKVVWDDTRDDVCWAEKLACTIVKDSLNFYLSLNDHHRRTFWDHVLLLIFTKLYKLPDDKFAVQFSGHQTQLCALISVDLKPMLRKFLGKIFSRVTTVFKIISHDSF